MRRFLLIAVPALFLSLALPDLAAAQSENLRDRVVAELQEDGYIEIRISRTLLGRMRFVAEGPTGRREIVMNPATGVILRDFVWFIDDEDDGDGQGGTLRDYDRGDDANQTGGDHGAGSDDDDDDDEDDGDHDEEDSDDDDDDDASSDKDD